MGLMDILHQAQKGEFFANVGRAAGVGWAATEATLGRMGPAIAGQLHKRTTRKRRGGAPSLDQIFGESLGTIRR